MNYQVIYLIMHHSLDMFFYYSLFMLFIKFKGNLNLQILLGWDERQHPCLNWNLFEAVLICTSALFLHMIFQAPRGFHVYQRAFFYLWCFRRQAFFICTSAFFLYDVSAPHGFYMHQRVFFTYSVFRRRSVSYVPARFLYMMFQAPGGFHMY